MQNPFSPRTYGLLSILFIITSFITNYLQSTELTLLHDKHDRKLLRDIDLLPCEQYSNNESFQNIEMYSGIQMISSFICGFCFAAALITRGSIAGAHFDEMNNEG